MSENCTDTIHISDTKNNRDFLNGKPVNHAETLSERFILDVGARGDWRKLIDDFGGEEKFAKAKAGYLYTEGGKPAIKYKDIVVEVTATNQGIMLSLNHSEYMSGFSPDSKMPNTIRLSIKGDHNNDRYLSVGVGGSILDGQSILIRPTDRYFFGSLLRSIGYNKLGDTISPRAKDELRDLAGEIELQKCFDKKHEELQEGEIRITKPYEGKSGSLVGVDTYFSASIDEPLGTMSLAYCSAIIIIDRKNKRHFLAHLFHTTPIQSIISVLSKFKNLADSEIYVMRGGAKTSPSIVNIVTALEQLGVKNITPLINTRTLTNSGETQEIITRNGEFYSFSQKGKHGYHDSRSGWRQVGTGFHSPYTSLMGK